MTRQNRLLLGVAAALAALAAYWFLLLAPKREEGAALAVKVAQTQASVAQAETTLASYRKAEGSYKTLYATVASLGKAVPADDDTRSLVVQLESAAAGSGVDFHSIEVGTAGDVGRRRDARPDGRQAAPRGRRGRHRRLLGHELRPGVQGRLPQPVRPVHPPRALRAGRRTTGST